MSLELPLMSQEPARHLYLSRLRINNFRSIASLDVPLGPLTVLVGPNGSGKSNIVDALRFLRDCLTRGLDQALLDRGGLSTLMHRGSRDTVPEVSLGVTYSTGNMEASLSYDLVLLGDDATGAVVKQEELSVVAPHLPRTWLVKEDTELRLYLDRRDAPPVIIKKSFNPRFFSVYGPVAMSISLQDLIEELQGPNAVEAYSDAFSDYGSTPWELSASLANSLFYALNPEQLRAPQAVSRSAPLDEAGQNLVAVLKQLRQDDRTATDMRLVLARLVSDLVDFSAEPAGSYLVGYLHYQTAKNDLRKADLSIESDGTLRLLGILAALYQPVDAERRFDGSGYNTPPVTAIEEPEVHIHPGMLAVLAELFLDTSQRKQLIITTHSPDLLDYLPPTSFLVVEKSDGTTQAGPLDPVQLEVARQQLFAPGELLRAQGLHRATDPAS
jgi:predicted ATPase